MAWAALLVMGQVRLAATAILSLWVEAVVAVGNAAATTVRAAAVMRDSKCQQWLTMVADEAMLTLPSAAAAAAVAAAAVVTVGEALTTMVVTIAMETTMVAVVESALSSGCCAVAVAVAPLTSPSPCVLAHSAARWL